MKTLLELYKSMLSSVGMVADNQGFVSTLMPGSETPKPFSVGGKRLVLPEEYQLQMTDWSNRIGFHPLLQSIQGGESRVMEAFRDRMNNYADFMLGVLIQDIAILAVKKELHKDLTPEQAAFLGPFADADEKFRSLITNFVTTKRMLKKNYEFVRFSVIKGREWKGQKRARVAVMHFPLYEALPKENKNAVINNQKFRIVDVKMLRAMYEFLFPNIRKAGFYELGSDSKIAPSMEALMGLYAQFTDVQNNAVSTLEPVISTSNALLIVNDWRSDLEKIEHYLPEIRKIPFLEGNAPSERVAPLNAPQRISEPVAETPVRAVGAESAAPVLAAEQIAQLQSLAMQEEAQKAQANNPNAPPPGQRIKLGLKAPTVSGQTAGPQISDAVAHRVLGTAAPAQPVAQPLAPTPPVGSILHAQHQQYHRPAPPQPVQPQQPQAMKVPESARVINNALYIPVENSGVSGVPQGAVMVDGKVYIPYASMGGGVAPMGMGGGGNVLGTPGFNPAAGRFGTQGAITDPSQVPGLSAEEINYFRTNPVMFQNYLSQVYTTNMQQAQGVAMARQNQVPRYLRERVAEAQQNQFSQGGFIPR